MSQSPVLHMGNRTHYANLMIKYICSVRAQEIIPELRVSNISMPYWGIDLPVIPARPEDRIIEMSYLQHFDIGHMASLIEANQVDRFNWTGYGQRIESWPSVERCRQIFVRSDVPGVEIENDCVLCPVRAGEILGAINPSYTVIPVDFYQTVQEATGLKLVFMGQTDDNLYMRELRSRFPDARIIPHRDAIEDFQTIRRARNIAIPVSSFAWLAAWLSHAEKIIMPVWGLYDFRINETDFLPIQDGRYEFYLFPEQEAVPLENLLEAHKAISFKWRSIPGREISAMRSAIVKG
jgi:hypothetical protein